MKDHHQSQSLSRRNRRLKLNLLVSFNGTFHRRPPPSGKLRYTGGETRIISVDRSISLSLLLSKIYHLTTTKNDAFSSFTLLYHLTTTTTTSGTHSSEETPLVSICSDDDVRRMVDTYEKLEVCNTFTRIWVFVCSSSSSSRCCSDVGFDIDNVRVDTHVVNLSGSEIVKTFSDDSLRKKVLKQQLLEKNYSDKIKGFCGDFDHSTKMDLRCPGKKPLSIGKKNLKFDGSGEYFNMYLMENNNFGNYMPVVLSNSRPLNGRDENSSVGSNGFRDGLAGQPLLFLGNANGVGAEKFPKPLCDSSANLMINGSGGGDREFRSTELAFLSNRNRENIMPWSVDCDALRSDFVPISSNKQLVGSGYQRKEFYGSGGVWGGSHNGIRNHRFSLSDTSNQRIGPFPIRNHRNGLTEIGGHRNGRLDGRPWMGKFYPGLRSSSNISKQGQTMRSCYPALSKSWLGCQQQKVEGVERTLACGVNNQTCAFDLSCVSQEDVQEQGGLKVAEYGEENSNACHLAYRSACINTADQSLLPVNNAENPLSPCSRAVNTPKDLLIIDPGSERNEVPCQTLCKNIVDEPTNAQTCCDQNLEAYLIDLHEIINTSNFSNNPGSSNGTGSGCDSKLVEIKVGYKSFSNHQNGASTLVSLPLHNLSLSSSEKVELPLPSLPASSDVSETLLKPQSTRLDLMNEEHFSSDPLAEKSNGVASDSFCHSASKMERVNNSKAEIQRDSQSDLSIDKEDGAKKTHKCSKVNGGIPSELADYYTHLATRELQTIKNSDLEYIKELGSGTYGTVFYGKWKGSDVAIKRIKPSSFTEGAVDEDRLVADFWKEAHILGQLHHPNIVALYGIVTDGPVNNLATVTEYMVNGSLKQVLRRKDRTIDRRKRLILAMDAAFGMEYLHEKNIVHFDLKSHNFLVNMKDPQRPVCKIGDLGLSKIKQRTLVSGGVRGTIPWMAPELLKIKKMVSEKVDVYSFGIVMWELLTGEEPYADMRSEEIIAGIIKGNLRPEIPSWCDPAWKSLMQRCWSSDPDSRPAFSEIAKELRAMAATMNIK